MPFATLIAPDDLHPRLGDDDWVVVDCRFRLDDPAAGRAAYAAAHVPCAVYAHLDDDLSARPVPGRTGRHPLPTPDAFARTLGRWGIDDATQVVAYDDLGGGIAARLWWMLRWLGHDAVAVLDGGWPAWQRAGHPVRGGVERRTARTFVPHPRPDRLADAAAVAALRADPGARLLDARAAERYAGTHEPIDFVAGHIPGAASCPFTDNLDDGGRFLPPAVLRRRYAEVVGDARPEAVVVYCGSGVTAAHDLLAMVHAGLPEGRLYPGSWSEWIVDPDRPVATGPAADDRP